MSKVKNELTTEEKDYYANLIKESRLSSRNALIEMLNINKETIFLIEDALENEPKNKVFLSMLKQSKKYENEINQSIKKLDKRCENNLV